MSGPDTPTKEAAPNEAQGQCLPDLKLPNIKLKAKIGSGGYGSVYIGYHDLMQRNVAVKILKSESSESGWYLRFQREAQALSKLSHPNIVQVYSFSITESGQAVLVMEYLEGKDIHSVVESQGRLDQEQAISITKSICDAIQFAHDNGILHRDLKPSNIIICDNGQVKVVDFGVAKIVDAESPQQKLTCTGQFVGTPAYMSPEECSGKPASTASDIYAVACILFFMLTGKSLFSGDSDMEIMLKHCKETPKLKRQKLPVALVSILGTALKKNPSERFPSCNAMKEALSKDSISFKIMETKSNRRSPKLLICAIATFLLAILIIFSRTSLQKEERYREQEHATGSYYAQFQKGRDFIANKNIDLALKTFKQLETIPKLSPTQRWNLYENLEGFSKTNEEKLAYSIKMLDLAENTASGVGRTEKTYWNVQSNIAFARATTASESEKALDRAFGYLQKVEPSADQTYVLWIDYYLLMSRNYRDRGQMQRALAVEMSGLPKMGERIFHNQGRLLEFYEAALKDAILLQDRKAETEIRNGFKNILFDVEMATRRAVICFFLGCYDENSSPETLAFFRELRKKIRKSYNQKEAKDLDRIVLEYLVSVYGSANNQPLTPSELSDIRSTFNFKGTNGMDYAQFKLISYPNANYAAALFFREGSVLAKRSMTEFLGSSETIPEYKLLFLAHLLYRLEKSKKKLPSEFQSYLESQFLYNAKQVLYSKNRLKESTVNAIVDSFAALTSASSGSLSFSPSFAKQIYATICSSAQLPEFCKIVALDWYAASCYKDHISLQFVDGLLAAFLKLVSSCSATEPYEGLAIQGCREKIGLLYEKLDHPERSAQLSRQLTTILLQKDFFGSADIEAQLLADWFAQQNRNMLKYGIHPDRKLMPTCTSRLENLCRKTISSSAQAVSLSTAATNLIELYAQLGDRREADELTTKMQALMKPIKAKHLR